MTFFCVELFLNYVHTVHVYIYVQHTHVYEYIYHNVYMFAVWKFPKSLKTRFLHTFVHMRQLRAFKNSNKVIYHNHYCAIRPLHVVVWFLVHRPHQIIITASYYHYVHCACLIMLFAHFTWADLYSKALFLHYVLVSLTLPYPILGVSLIN